MLVKANSSSEIVRAAVDDLNSRTFRKHASLFVVQCKKTKRILVVKRFKDDQIGLPCGKIDAEETPYEAACRELYEETGVSQHSFCTPVRHIDSISFEGTLVHIFKTEIEVEQAAIGPAPGFEKETSPQWMTLEELIKVESRFTSFNIVALHKSGLI